MGCASETGARRGLLRRGRGDWGGIWQCASETGSACRKSGLAGRDPVRRPAVDREEVEVSKKKKKKAAEREARLLNKQQKKAKARKRRRKLLLLALIGGGAVAAKAAKKPQPTPGSGTVTRADAEPGPLATMMSEMVKGFLQDAQKKALADKMNVSVAIQDIDNPEMAASMTFKGSDVTVSNGVIEGVDIYIGTELALLLTLSGAGKGLEMIKWLKTEDGKKVVNAVKSGRFKVRGAVKNAPQMALFQKFLS